MCQKRTDPLNKCQICTFPNFVYRKTFLYSPTLAALGKVKATYNGLLPLQVLAELAFSPLKVILGEAFPIGELLSLLLALENVTIKGYPQENIKGTLDIETRN